MKKVIITTDPLSLTGEQHIREFSKTGASKRNVHHSTLIGWTIADAKWNDTGEIVLELVKHHQIPHQTRSKSAAS